MDADEHTFTLTLTFDTWLKTYAVRNWTVSRALKVWSILANLPDCDDGNYDYRMTNFIDGLTEDADNILGSDPDSDQKRQTPPPIPDHPRVVVIKEPDAVNTLEPERKTVTKKHCSLCRKEGHDSRLCKEPGGGRGPPKPPVNQQN